MNGEARFPDARERLLGAALGLFASRGYNGTRTREIAKAAGVNQVTLFRIFGSKERLFAAVLLDRVTAVVPRWESVVLDEWSGDDASFEVLADALQADIADPVFARLLFFTVLEKRELLEECFGPHLRSLHRALSQKIHNRIELGSMRPLDTGLGAGALLALFLNHSVLADILHSSESPSSQVARELVDIWLHGVMATAPGSAAEPAENKFSAERDSAVPEESKTEVG